MSQRSLLCQERFANLLLIWRQQVSRIEEERGSHRNYAHPNVSKPVTISGKAGDDVKKYQERAVSKAIEESKP